MHNSDQSDLQLTTCRCYRGVPLIVDLPVRGRQHIGLRSYLHRSWSTSHRQPVPRLIGDSRPLRRLPGDDFRRCQRFTGLLDFRSPVLRHLGSFRCHVQHRQHPQSVCYLFGSVHTHQRSTQVSRI